MADISSVLLSGTNYNIKDATARSGLANKADIASPTFTGTPKAPTPSSGDNSTNIATTAFVTSAVEAAASGAVAFKGVINANTAISSLSSWTAGWYWVVGTAGTYVGETCEVGDMIFCTTTATTYSTHNFNVVQVNITGLGALAFKDSASGSFTPAGSISIDDFIPTGNITIGGASGTSYTPAGSIAVGDDLLFGTAYTPEGTISAPTITVTPSTTSLYQITGVGSAPSWSASVTNEVLSFSFSAGSVPTRAQVTGLVNGITSATATAPTFSGTAKEFAFNGTASNFKFNGTSGAVSGSFSGTAGTVTVE